MMGVGRVGEQGLLLCSIAVGEGRPAAVHSEAASYKRSPTKAVAPPTQAVGARPAHQTRSKVQLGGP